MAPDVIYKTIKQTVNEFLPNAYVVLFGSRARGNDTAQSDYDLLIVTPQLFDRDEKLSYCGKLHKAIVKAIKSPVDLLLYSEEEVATNRELPGHVVRFAMKEGIRI